MSRRFRDYFNINYLARPGRKMIIHSSLLKNGYSAFKLEILEYCPHKDLLSREQYYLDLLKPKYNILAKAGSSLGFKHSEESKDLIRAAALNRSEETRAKFAASKLGRKLSDETRAKIVAILQGEEAKSKMKAYQSKRTKHPIPGIKIEVTNIETGVCTIYESLREAANALNMSAGTISRRIKLNIIKPYKGKFLIKAYENSE